VGGPVKVDLYFSANNTLDSSDALLVTARKKVNIKPAHAKTFKLKVRGFPATATDGAYALLAQVTSPDGSTDVVPAGSIAVEAQKLDLSGAFVAGTQTTALVGKKSRLDVLISNNGNVVLKAPVGLALTASTTGTPAAGDLSLLTVTRKLKLKAGQTKHLRLTFRVPVGAPAGSYFPVLQLDTTHAVAETDEANNLAVSVNQFTIL
jgi:uncharacterized membrane protein